MIHRAHPLVAPLPHLLQPLGTLARRAFARAFQTWRHGHVTIALPGGGTLALGEAGQEHQSLEILDDRFFVRALLRGELGVGESYVAGEWRAADLTGVIRMFVRNLFEPGAELGLETRLTRLGRLPARLEHRLRFRRAASERNIHAHYDLGNAFYRLFLDEDLMYSCAVYERGDETLEQAQRCKSERLCAALELGPSDHLLEIG
ncbi:MAG TPA: class I SAM-dependent methyltransferase, partial [Kofleriaceae bacterium]|nr:class I SAM-dependent methyltransferase [Kofleriaceae bacterium]